MIHREPIQKVLISKTSVENTVKVNIALKNSNNLSTNLEIDNVIQIA